MNRLSVRGKDEKIARIVKGKGEFFTLSPNREPVHRLTKSMERWHRKYVSTFSPTQTTFFFQCRVWTQAMTLVEDDLLRIYEF